MKRKFKLFKRFFLSILNLVVVVVLTLSLFLLLLLKLLHYSHYTTIPFDITQCGPNTKTPMISYANWGFLEPTF